MLIFEITEEKIVFSHYSAIISTVQLYIYLLVPFLLFRKAMHCISSKQGFEPAGWDFYVDFATNCAIFIKPLNFSKAQTHHFWKTYKSRYLKGCLLRKIEGLLMSTVELLPRYLSLLPGTFLSPCSCGICCPRGRPDPS